MGELLYGSELSERLKQEMKEEVASYADRGRKPRLDTILVGDNPASLSYIKGKKKACAYVGIENEQHFLPAQTTQQQLEELIASLNENPLVDGILLQMPLPDHLNSDHAICCIDPSKDVDGLHPINVGALFASEPCLKPCTPLGVMSILDAMGCQMDGRHAVVIGRSRLVGLPIAKMLLDRHATVTICHSHTENLASVTKGADILVVAAGKKHMITSEHVKEGAYVVDVGINRGDDGHLYGDVDTEDVKEHVTMVTPVPRGVGPMTICSLLQNTLKAYREREGLC